MRPNRSAFTLIECVLALGIASTVVVTLMVLLPAGLDATRVASQRVAESLIVERVRQQNETVVVLGDFYFDGHGAPLVGRNADAVFAARVEAVSGVALPGEDIASLRRIRIRVSDRALAGPFDDEARLHEYQLLLAPMKGAGP